MNSKSWLLVLSGIRLPVFLALSQEYPESISIEDLARRTGNSSRRVGDAVHFLVAEGLALRLHRSAWVASSSSVLWLRDLFNKPEQAVDNYSVANQLFPQPDKLSVPTGQNVRLVHDHDEMMIIAGLRDIGFDRATRWLKKVDVELVRLWLEWLEAISRKKRESIRNPAGLVRASVQRGEQPPGLSNGADHQRMLEIHEEFLEVVER
jgi:hypothetical protein